MEATAARIERWTFEEALPFWADAGLDRARGGCFEALTLPSAEPAPVDFKRLRVLARQIYVFSHAELLGWSGARAAADHVYAFFRRAWGGPEAGWPRLLTPEGAVKDATLDLYDHAFALFALGWRYRATRDPDALALANATLDFVEARFAHPGGEGFHAALPPSGPRQQNPHMHMTEAALVLAEGAGSDRFKALADRLAGLFQERLLRGAPPLREFFDDDWRPAAGDAGRRAEPGHMFEWAWILGEHQRIAGADHAALIATLVDWAEAHGVDPETHVTFDAVRDDGVPLEKSSRTWPNTERIKGWIAASEHCGRNGAAAIEGSVNLLFARYLDPAPRGCWIDSFDANGRASAKLIPTSTLYHLFLAFAEAMRFARV